MARGKETKLTKQEKRRLVLNQLLTDPKTEQMLEFYDYIKAAVPILDQKAEEDRVFSRWLKRKFRQSKGLNEEDKAVFSVQEYIDWGAEKLASEMEHLDRWYKDSLWTLDLPREKYAEFWKRIVALWWEKDSFPELSTKMVQCTPRDVVIYALMALDFSVEEADQFLDEFSRMKKSKYLRRLYFLDYKEGMFRWILSWNENHPQQKVPYGRACLLYEEYGGELLGYVKAELDKLCANITRECEYWYQEIEESEYQSKNYKKNVSIVLNELNVLRDDCMKMKARLCNSREELYKESHSENLKRALTICVYGRRLLERKKDELRRRDFFADYKRSAEDRFRMIRKWTDETAANRGTEFAWFQMMKYTLATSQNFTESFEIFKKETIPFLSDAYWGQFSQLMKLYGMSGGFYEEHRQFVRKKTFSASTRQPKLYKNAVVISKKDRKYLSFALGNKDVTEAIKNGTANSMYLSELVQPVWRNSEDIFSCTKVDSESKFSMLWNQYEKWCQGKKGPYEAYTRNVILELALAANMGSMSEIQSVMSLAGSREWNLLNSKEALVYLVVRYRDELKKVIRDISDLMEVVQVQGIRSEVGEKSWIELQKKVRKLPESYLENLPDYMGKIGEIPKETQEKQRFVQEAAEEWQYVITEEIPLPTAIEYLHMADRLGILLRASYANIDKIREKMFYGPYTTDFSKQEGGNTKGVAEELAWLEIQRSWGALLSNLLNDKSVRIVFDFWYQNMRTGLRSENFLGVSIDKWEDSLDLVEKRIGRVKPQLEVKMETACAKDWRTQSRGKCENIKEALETFHEAIASAKFMKQDPNAAETKYILEQWITLLAVMELLEISTEASVDLLEEYVYHWIATGGLNYFDYRIYKKKYSLESLEQNVVHWEEKEDLDSLYKFWGEIYRDYRTLCASVRWYEERRPEQADQYSKKLEAMKNLILAEGNEDALREDGGTKLSPAQTRFGWMKLNWKDACSYRETQIKYVNKQSTSVFNEKNERKLKDLREWYQRFYDDMEVSK